MFSYCGALRLDVLMGRYHGVLCSVVKIGCCDGYFVGVFCGVL